MISTINERPQNQSEREVYEAMVRCWGRRIIDGFPIDAHTIINSIAESKRLDPDRAFNLKLAAYADVREIADFSPYIGRHQHTAAN